MNDPSPSRFSKHDVVHTLHVHGLSLLSAAYVVYLLFGCWVPFDWSLQTAQASRPIFELGQSESGMADIFTNVALYIPAGAIFFVMLLSKGRSPKYAGIQAVLLAATLSLAIEAGQKFLDSRFSSVTDWMCNSSGAAIGILIAWFGRELLHKGLNRYTHELEHHPVVAGTKLYALFLLVVGLSPFLPIYDMAHLIRVWKEASYIPFAEVSLLRTKAAALLELGMIDAHWAAIRDLWIMIFRWGFEGFLFACLGFAVCRSFIRQSRLGRVGSTTAACIICFWFAAALSVAQIFILTRGFYATDILARTTGAAIGASIAGIFRREKDDTVTLSWAWRMRIAPTVAVTMFLIILLNGMAPFAFEFNTLRAESTLWSPKVLPFYSYHIAKPYVAAADMLSKSILYLIFAAALAGAWINVRERTLKTRAFVIAAATGTLAAAIELAQLFNHSRTTTLTDPILAIVAAVIGVTMEQYLTDLHLMFLQSNGKGESQTIIQQAEADAVAILPKRSPKLDPASAIPTTVVAPVMPIDPCETVEDIPDEFEAVIEDPTPAIESTDDSTEYGDTDEPVSPVPAPPIDTHDDINTGTENDRPHDDTRITSEAPSSSSYWDDDSIDPREFESVEDTAPSTPEDDQVHETEAPEAEPSAATEPAIVAMPHESTEPTESDGHRQDPTTDEATSNESEPAKLVQTETANAEPEMTEPVTTTPAESTPPAMTTDQPDIEVAAIDKSAPLSTTKSQAPQAEKSSGDSPEAEKANSNEESATEELETTKGVGH